MKLVKFCHDRCGEWDCVEYMLAPDVMTKSEIRDTARQVSEEMIADMKKLKGVGDDEYTDAPPNVWQPEYDKYPDKTVAEVKAIFAEKRAARKKWEQEHSEWKRSFETRMREHGFMALWQDEAEDYLDEIAVSWGHNHGLELAYGSHVKGVDDL